MKVFIVERDCIDPCFEPHVIAIFSSLRAAEIFVATQKDEKELNISEWNIDSEEKADKSMYKKERS